MLPLLSRFFDTNDREIKKLRNTVDQINLLEADIRKLKDKDFPERTEELKERIKKGESIHAVLPEAFALAREASLRATGLRHYDVQLMAAISLASGKIAEQKTGEGKTLSAVPALYLHALTGRGVHLVTVNDYLARRDAGWMGPIFHFLGVSVSSMINDRSYIYDPKHEEKDTADYRLSHLRLISRKEAYQADVTYGINSEFGFDYLRDNMAPDVAGTVQRDYYFAIVDEVDSVLIDEARTPHIISQPDEAPSERYYEYAKVVDKLSSETDFKIDEKLRTAHLTDHGIGKIEKLYGIANIYEKDFDTVYHLEAALRARTLYKKEKDYIVKDNQVILVDEFTGRLMEGRRLSEGLHQAIEAKENVPIQRESKTMATVSLQNYFRKYELLAGMTGTAVTEAEEFNKIYKLDVVVIPTHNKLQRVDHSDAVYKTTRAKISAVADAIVDAAKKGQPVLVGTTSIDKNEIISQTLKRRGVKHEVLNAKNHQREAQIIALAGRKGAITVATNMAGRGVDIVLGGDQPKKTDGTTDQNSSEYKKWKKEHDEVVALGGLYVLGTERHESRRIDNQLRGRSGRQGDPGTSRFFVALDDDIMRLFGGDKIAGIMSRFNMPEDVPLEHPLVSKAIENAQVKVEGFNFDMRKHLVEYDDVLNKQREIIYGLRKKLLDSASDGSDNTTKNEMLERIDKAIETIVMMSVGEQPESGESQNERIVTEFATIIPFDAPSQQQLVKQLQQLPSDPEKVEFLTKLAHDLYKKKEEHFGDPTIMRHLEKNVMLSVVDNLWMNHLDSIDHLREGIRLQAYAQKDPLVEYKNEAYKMFEQLVFAIDDEIVHRIYKVHVDHPKHQHEVIVENTPESEVSDPDHPKKATQTMAERKKTKIRTNVARDKVSNSEEEIIPTKNAKLGRNDPCPCGSGLKYKKCGLINAPQHKS
jgi:preprotein translocase subunit SecA